ncbi:MFS transporter [Bacillus subtilis]|uniref:MFS transporter n=1 Tax=Bacillus subtilis TaxID=1423 RepID=UPI002029BC1F|nr:MFS transporter [Bacillus subtilis]
MINSLDHTEELIGGLKDAGIRAVFAFGTSGDAEYWDRESTLTNMEDAARVKKAHFQSSDQLLTMGLAIRGPEFSSWETSVFEIETARSLDALCSMHIGFGNWGAEDRSIERLHKAGLLGITSVRMVFANLGGLVVAFFVPFLATFLSDTTGNTALGWQMTMAFLGVLGGALLIFCFKSTNERVTLQKPEEKIKFSDIFVQLRVNRPLVVLSIFFIIIFGVNSISNSVGIYYVTYNLGREDLVKWYGLIGSLPALMVLPFIPKHSGVDIVAQPPGKKLQNLSLLSGGERALTAIALLFSILKVRPVPFCVLDEVEAALDEANVFRFAQYLKKYSQETQFIVITHRKGTMEEADVLYGVTMQESGVSKLVSVKLEETKELVQ